MLKPKNNGELLIYLAIGYVAFAEMLSWETSKFPGCIVVSEYQSPDNETGNQTCATLHEGVMRGLIFLWHHATHDNIIALGTVMIAIFTWTLWRSNAKLWDVANAQSEDTKILQRAYLSVDSAGVSPLDPGKTCAAHVIVKNVGNLPARDVKWFISAKFSTNGRLNDFPIDRSVIYGNNVVPPGTEMKRSQNFRATSAEISALVAEKAILYVWGEIFYTDGFGTARSTKFCHRYSRGVVMALPHYSIGADSMRYHQFGNDAD